MAFLRNALGVLSLALGLVLLGECAAHSASALFHAGVRKDMAFYLLRVTFFAPGQHTASYQALLASGVTLSLLGAAMLKAWTLPLFLFSGLCFAVLGGMVAGRVVVPKGGEALLVQDGVSGIGVLFGNAYDSGDIGEPGMVLGLGVFGLLTGLFLQRMAERKPAAPARSARPGRDGRTAPSAPAGPPEPASFEEAPPAPEEGVPTPADLDLSPDLETTEVGIPTPAGLEEPVPLEEPAASGPAPLEEPEAPASAPEAAPAGSHVPELPMPSRALPLASLLLGLGSLGAPGALYFRGALLPAPVLGQVWAAGIAAALCGAGLSVLSRPMGALGKAALAVCLLGLAGGGALIAFGAWGGS